MNKCCNDIKFGWESLDKVIICPVCKTKYIVECGNDGNDDSYCYLKEIEIMNLCEFCEFWNKNENDFGDCENNKISVNSTQTDSNMVQCGGEDGYGDYFRTKKDFGCILFKIKYT